MGGINNAITKSTIREMTNILDWLYKRGVEDAYLQRDNEGMIREYLEKTSKTGVYAFLSDDIVEIDWREWALRIMAKARTSSWNGAMSRFFNLMGNFGSNYLSVFIPVTLQFYRRGIKDYLKYPRGCSFSQFISYPHKCVWTSKGIRRRKPRYYCDEVQLTCFDLKRRDEEFIQDPDFQPRMFRKLGICKPRHYDMFIKVFGILTIDSEIRY